MEPCSCRRQWYSWRRTAAPSTAQVTRYLIVSGDSSSGSWDSHDEPRFEAWRSKYGSHYAWFRQDGRDYIVTDGRILAQFEDAMAPQREVNSRQSEVNRHQAEVNRLQGGVNNHQADVNRAQAEVNRKQSLVNRGEEEQTRVNQLQSEVNGKQHVVNAEQDKVNQRQSVVNREQSEVNQMQAQASAEIDKALRASSNPPCGKAWLAKFAKRPKAKLARRACPHARLGVNVRGMSASTPAIAPVNPNAAPARVLSIDIFRGLTILVMVFVNDVAGVKGLPWWTHHMPEGVNGMTYVDMVFSAFLFIVGISMPLAIDRRRALGDSWLDVLKHVVVRSLSLVAIGYILANLGNADPQLTGMALKLGISWPSPEFCCSGASIRSWASTSRSIEF